MAKCEVCKNKINENFLKKIFGTVVKDEKGKKHLICSECQRHLGTKEKFLDEISKK